MAADKLPKMLQGLFEQHFENMVKQSWFLQDRGERKLRLKTIIALSVELERIRKITLQATALGEGAIEAIIEGDWKRAEEYAGDLTFPDEAPEYVETFRKLWEPFVVLIQTAAAESKRLVPGQHSRPH